MKKMLFFVMYFLFILNVHAFTLNVEIEDDYYVHFENSVSELKSFKVLETDTPVFVLEPCNDIELFDLNKTYPEFYKKIKVNDELQDILYLGYNYKNHHGKEWYYLTQYMLWDNLGYKVDIKNSDGISITTIFSTEYNEYLKLIKESLILPSYFNNELHLNYGEEYLLQDSNEAESNYKLIPYAKLRLSTKDGINYLTGIQVGETNLALVRKEQNSRYNNLYFNDEYGYIENKVVSKKVFLQKVYVHGGTIKIINKDNNGEPIEGSVFYIYNNEDKNVGIVVTDKEGISISSTLPYDDYYLVNEDKEKINFKFVDFSETIIELENNNYKKEIIQEDIKNDDDNIEDNKENDIYETKIEEVIHNEDNNEIYEEVIFEVPKTYLDITKYVLLIAFSLLLLGCKIYEK